MFCGCACVCWMGTCSTHLDEWQLRDPELLGVPPECQLEDFAASRRRLGRVGSEEEVPCRQPWMELQAAPLAVSIAHDHAFDLVCIAHALWRVILWSISPGPGIVAGAFVPAALDMTSQQPPPQHP